MKTSELTGDLLDKWVAVACVAAGLYTRVYEVYTKPYLFENDDCILTYAANTSINQLENNPSRKHYRVGSPERFSPSTNAAQGLPIAEHMQISLDIKVVDKIAICYAKSQDGKINYTGTTYLQAAMRAFVAMSFGENIPEKTYL